MNFFRKLFGGSADRRPTPTPESLLQPTQDIYDPIYVYCIYNLIDEPDESSYSRINPSDHVELPFHIAARVFWAGYRVQCTELNTNFRPRENAFTRNLNTLRTIISSLQRDPQYSYVDLYSITIIGETDTDYICMTKNRTTDAKSNYYTISKEYTSEIKTD